MSDEDAQDFEDKEEEEEEQEKQKHDQTIELSDENSDEVAAIFKSIRWKSSKFKKKETDNKASKM